MSKIRVLVQKGHVAPREPGFESGTGTAGEQELVTKIGVELNRLLTADGRFDSIMAPGDIPDGIKVDAAVFLHADGSASSSASGFSFGYPSFAVNEKLADMIAEEFFKLPGHPPHHKDNYTSNLSGYYGYRRVDTPGPEVLVEHGFLTNPSERKWLTTHTAALARAEYVALCRFFKLVPFQKTLPTGKPFWLIAARYPDGKLVYRKTSRPGFVLAGLFTKPPRPRSVMVSKVGG